MLRSMSEHDHPHPHDHAHPHGLPARGRTPDELGRLRLVLYLTALFMLVEFVGGVVARSLALVADAGHMLADVAALGVALVALQLSRRPASMAKTYGYARLEILAALVNGALLLVIAGSIAWRAWLRIRTPVEVDGTLLSAVAVGGLIVNVFAARVLHPHIGSSLNTRAAYMHVLGDLLGSVGALLAGLIVWVTGWSPADSIVSVVIAAMILIGAWQLVREATDVLLEAAPSHIEVWRVLADLRDIPGLHDVHDLHVWTLTSGFVALSGHGVIDDPYQQREVLDEVRRRLRDHGIEHVTFQLEPRALVQMKVQREG
jgi:cobalt-zinc-cadmium efflux system protein